MTQILPIKYMTIFLGALSIVMTGACSQDTSEKIRILQHSNAQLTMQASPDIGGRLTHVSLHNHPNILSSMPHLTTLSRPSLKSDGHHHPYNGHIIWLGPQSQWWADQDVNKARRERRAAWPPDPWMTLASNAYTEHPDGWLFVGSKSALSAMQVNKSFRFLQGETQANTIEHKVIATNRGSEDASWDIWFNSRVRASAHVFVPVSSELDVRLEHHFNQEHNSPISYTIRQGLLYLDQQSPTAPRTIKEGKIYLQPSAGWIAVFTQGQCLILRFPWLQKELIHPEQGQVELYTRFEKDKMDEGIIEVETHATFTTLPPNSSMEATQLWTVLPYTGEQTLDGYRRFLQQQSYTSPEHEDHL